VDSIVRDVAVAALLLSGVLAGLSLDKVIVQLPARHRMGAVAYAGYARAADLGNGVVFYALVGIAAAVRGCMAWPLMAAAGRSRAELDGLPLLKPSDLGKQALRGSGAVATAVSDLSLLPNCPRSGPGPCAIGQAARRPPCRAGHGRPGCCRQSGEHEAARAGSPRAYSPPGRPGHLRTWSNHGPGPLSNRQIPISLPNRYQCPTGWQQLAKAARSSSYVSPQRLLGLLRACRRAIVGGSEGRRLGK
jgi:hypothetical protein